MVKLQTKSKKVNKTLKHETETMLNPNIPLAFGTL